MDDVPTRYAHVRNGLFELKRVIEEWKPDALIVIADDQNENFTGAECFSACDRYRRGCGFFRPTFRAERTCRCDVEVARIILNSAVEGGFNLWFSGSFQTST